MGAEILTPHRNSCSGSEFWGNKNAQQLTKKGKERFHSRSEIVSVVARVCWNLSSVDGKDQKVSAISADTGWGRRARRGLVGRIQWILFPLSFAGPLSSICGLWFFGLRAVLLFWFWFVCFGSEIVWLCFVFGCWFRFHASGNAWEFLLTPLSFFFFFVKYLFYLDEYLFQFFKSFGC